MAHNQSVQSRSETRAESYRTAAIEIAAVLEGESDRVARMATVCAMLARRFDHYFWAGFYVVDSLKPDELVVGPYQGSLGCAAAQRRETVVVEDVHAFDGHIACDGRSQSEIVVPVFDRAGRLIAVFDVDATTPAAFDAVDAEGLQAILRDVFAV